jgi:hypothetical protein
MTAPTYHSPDFRTYPPETRGTEMRSLTLYHGGALDGQFDPFAVGLWATDDPDAAADYAAAWSDGKVHRIPVPEDAKIIALRDAVDAELADLVEQAEPQQLASGFEARSRAERLVEQGVWAVYVEIGDCHPDTGRAHRSWWIIGRIETIEAIA